MVSENGFFRDDVVKTLTENRRVDVTFYKVNGDMREMACTLHPDVIGEDVSVVEAKYDPNQIRVFDLDNDSWRSFLLTNLVTVEVP
jgi:hypothetical protein